MDYLLVQADKQWYNYYLQVDGIPVARTGKVGDRTIVYDTGHKPVSADSPCGRGTETGIL